MNEKNLTQEAVPYFTIPFELDNHPAKSLKLLSCENRDQVSIAAVSGGWKSYESPLPLLIARASLKRNIAFLDIGSNTGYYSLISALAGASEVHAFEPVPFIADIMEKNIQLNFPDANKISLHRIAISNKNEISTIYMPEQGHGLIETSASLNKDFRSAHSAEFSIPCQTLDTFLREEAPSLANELVIKIDVESLEPQVLIGAQETISSKRPLIFLEILPNTNEKFFYEWAYRNNYAHATLQPPNNVIPNTTIEGSIKFRDHIFYPAEQALTDLF